MFGTDQHIKSPHPSNLCYVFDRGLNVVIFHFSAITRVLCVISKNLSNKRGRAHNSLQKWFYHFFAPSNGSRDTAEIDEQYAQCTRHVASLWFSLPIVYIRMYMRTCATFTLLFFDSRCSEQKNEWNYFCRKLSALYFLFQKFFHIKHRTRVIAKKRKITTFCPLWNT